MDKIQIAAVFLILAGAFIPVMCIIKMQMIRRFKKNAVITSATITHSEKRAGLKGSVYYMHAIQYNDRAGQVFTGHIITAKKILPGATVPIMYNIADPAKYKSNFGKYLPWLLGFSLIIWALLIWVSCWLLTSEMQ